jgi:hypothetical protein
MSDDDIIEPRETALDSLENLRCFVASITPYSQPQNMHIASGNRFDAHVRKVGYSPFTDNDTAACLQKLRCLVESITPYSVNTNTNTNQCYSQLRVDHVTSNAGGAQNANQTHNHPDKDGGVYTHTRESELSNVCNPYDMLTQPQNMHIAYDTRFDAYMHKAGNSPYTDEDTKWQTLPGQNANQTHNHTDKDGVVHTRAHESELSNVCNPYGMLTHPPNMHIASPIYNRVNADIHMVGNRPYTDEDTEWQALPVYKPFALRGIL